MKKIIYFLIFRPLPEILMLNYTLMKRFDNSSIRISNYISLYLRYRLLRKFGVEFCKGAYISKPVKLRHPVGIVIGGGAKIGNNVTIHQGVTLGVKDFNHTGKSIFCSQIIEDEVIIGAGAKILGNVTIGKGAIIASNEVITKDVPPNVIALGNNKYRDRK